MSSYWHAIACWCLAAYAHGVTSLTPKAPAPASFDCKMRQLAYKFGQNLQPRHGRFEPLLHALGLAGDDCTAPDGGDVSLDTDAASPPLGKGDTIFVDPDRGQDAWPRSIDQPFRTLQAAVAKWQNLGKPSIVLRGGTHYLPETILLDPTHSGLSISTFPGEKSTMSGGIRLNIAAWTKNGTTRSGDTVFKTNVKGQVSDVPGLQIDGVRKTRARYPNLPGGIEVSPGYGNMISSDKAVWTRPRDHSHDWSKFYEDDTPDHLRNTTADGEFKFYKIGVNGECEIYDPPVSYWCSRKPEGGGAFRFRIPTGVTPHKGALPHSPYNDVSEAIFNVFRPGRWANWMFEVESYDPKSNNFTFGRGGFQGSRGHDQGGDFFVENVFEELDYPGEFFFNSTTGDLYLVDNAAPLTTTEVIVPRSRVLMNVSGTPDNPVRNVTLDGLTFKASRYTYMDPHGVPSGGDWALDRIAAVFLQGTEGVRVKNCTFERLDGNAAMISGYNRYTTIENSDFSYIGANAIVSWGYTNETIDSGFPYYTPRTNVPDGGIDGTDGNHPLFNHISGNLAREIGLYEKQSSFYMQAKTARSTIEGNVFFNGPRAGVNYNDGFGGGDVLRNNLVFSTCRESGDHGPFNSWDRQPYLTSVRTGQPSMIMEWREIHHNFFIDNYSPQEAIDNDDGSSYYHSHHNFLVYGMQGMKNDFGGHDNWHYNNVYAYTGQAAGLTPTLPGHEDYFSDNTVVLTGDNVGSVQCTGSKTQMSGNTYFTPSGDISICGKTLEEIKKQGMEAGSTVHKTPTDDYIISSAVNLLSIPNLRSETLVV